MYQMWIAIIGALIMAGGLGGVYYLIIRQNATLGLRALQFVLIIFVSCLLLILGVLNILGREVIGTILGVLVGYFLSGAWKEPS